MKEVLIQKKPFMSFLTKKPAVEILTFENGQFDYNGQKFGVEQIADIEFITVANVMTFNLKNNQTINVEESYNYETIEKIESIIENSLSVEGKIKFTFDFEYYEYTFKENSKNYTFIKEDGKYKIYEKSGKIEYYVEFIDDMAE